MALNFDFEKEEIQQGFSLIAGVDEAGVGPLAGPVVAAAVVLDLANYEHKKKYWSLVYDSKQVSVKQRIFLSEFIKEQALDFFISSVSHKTIDKINILNAALLAMKKSIEGLKSVPHLVLVDGKNKIKNLRIRQETIIRGDETILSIAAASILAKVERDRIMAGFHKKYSRFNFVKHKGYPTKEHKQLIKKFGPCPIHRKSFKFIQEMIK